MVNNAPAPDATCTLMEPLFCPSIRRAAVIVAVKAMGDPGDCRGCDKHVRRKGVIEIQVLAGHDAWRKLKRHRTRAGEQQAALGATSSRTYLKRDRNGFQPRSVQSCQHDLAVVDAVGKR